MRKVVLLLAAVLMVLTTNAWARGPMDLLLEAGQAYQKKDYHQAITRLQTALEDIWNEAPLAVVNAHFTDNEPKGFGDFQPRANSVFSSLEPVRLYYEIIGAVPKKTAKAYKTSLSYDFRVIDDTGQVLGGQKGLKGVELDSSFFSTQVMMYLTLNFKGLAEGRYTLEITLHDNHSSKTATHKMPFEIK